MIRHTRMRRMALLMTVIAMCVLVAPEASASDVLGYNETLLTATNEPGTRGQEMPLGDVVADAVRSVANADIALVHGGSIRYNLLAGDITAEDIALLFPKETSLAMVEITPAELWNVLEHSVSTFSPGPDERIDWQKSAWDGFLQVSGLSFSFDVSNEVGERVTEIVLSDGRSLSRQDTATVLTVAATAPVFSGELGHPLFDAPPLEPSLSEAFLLFVKGQEGTLKAPQDINRIQCRGAADDSLLGDNRSAMVLFLVCAGVIALTGALTFGKSAAWKALKDRAMPETPEEKNSVLNRFMK